MRVAIIGAGVAGLTAAVELVERGVNVDVFERSSALGQRACSWYAGGMLAPWCERESAEPMVEQLGAAAATWWQRHVRKVVSNGSLVLSPNRDRAELNRFSRRTTHHSWLTGPEIADLEPDLAGRFEKGLLFPGEAHLDPRLALEDLLTCITDGGGEVHFDTAVQDEVPGSTDVEFVIDCRGFAARRQLQALRGVKGEMLMLRCPDLALSRPVRLLHPRHPVYLVPRGDDRYMLGATVIENSERDRITARSMLELLSAAYALHPGLGEAEVIETGVDVRPAFRDNLPAVHRRGNRIFVNGLFRHGFLLGPAMAQRVADAVMEPQLMAELPLCA